MIPYDIICLCLPRNLLVEGHVFVCSWWSHDVRRASQQRWSNSRQRPCGHFRWGFLTTKKYGQLHSTNCRFRMCKKKNIVCNMYILYIYYINYIYIYIHLIIYIKDIVINHPQECIKYISVSIMFYHWKVQFWGKLAGSPLKMSLCKDHLSPVVTLISPCFWFWNDWRQGHMIVKRRW